MHWEGRKGKERENGDWGGREWGGSKEVGGEEKKGELMDEGKCWEREGKGSGGREGIKD